VIGQALSKPLALDQLTFLTHLVAAAPRASDNLLTGSAALYRGQRPAASSRRQRAISMTTSTSLWATAVHSLPRLALTALQVVS
jgi:hypothetical protein